MDFSRGPLFLLYAFVLEDSFSFLYLVFYFYIVCFYEVIHRYSFFPVLLLSSILIASVLIKKKKRISHWRWKTESCQEHWRFLTSMVPVAPQQEPQFMFSTISLLLHSRLFHWSCFPFSNIQTFSERTKNTVIFNNRTGSLCIFLFVFAQICIFSENLTFYIYFFSLFHLLLILQVMFWGVKNVIYGLIFTIFPIQGKSLQLLMSKDILNMVFNLNPCNILGHVYLTTNNFKESY